MTRGLGEAADRSRVLSRSHAPFQLPRADAEQTDDEPGVPSGRVTPRGRKRITPWGSVFDLPAWSPDGRWIGFQRPFGQIWVVHPDGTDLHRIPVDLPRDTGAASPSWSPDGRWMVFSLQRGEDAQLYRVRPDGTGLLRVSLSGALDGNPDWSD